MANMSRVISDHYQQNGEPTLIRTLISDEKSLEIKLPFSEQVSSDSDNYLENCQVNLLESRDAPEALSQLMKDLFEKENGNSCIFNEFSILKKKEGKYRIGDLRTPRDVVGKGAFGRVYSIPGYTLDTQEMTIKDKPHVVKIATGFGFGSNFIQQEKVGSELATTLRKEYKERYNKKLSGLIEPGRVHRLKNGQACMVMKKYNKGDARQFASSSGHSLAELSKKFLWPLETLMFFGEMGVQHFDIKPPNLFVHENKMAIGDTAGAFILPEVAKGETYGSFLRKIHPDHPLKMPACSPAFTPSKEYKEYEKKIEKLKKHLETADPEARMPSKWVQHCNTLRESGVKVGILQMGLSLFFAYAESEGLKGSDYFSYEFVTIEGREVSFLQGAEQEEIYSLFQRSAFIKHFGDEKAQKLANLILRMVAPPKVRATGKEAYETYKNIVGQQKTESQ